jgi:hypothetical protein
MAVVDLQQFRAQKERAREKVEKMMRKYRIRFLRITKPFVAQRTYHCDYCIDAIVPGDEYVREIYVNHSRLWEKFKHFPDCFAPTEDEVDETMKEMEHEREVEREAAPKCA